MAKTMMDLVNRVLQNTGQKSGKTVLNEADSTQYLFNMIVDALGWVYRKGPTQIDTTFTMTLPAETRLISMPDTTIDVYNIEAWSFAIKNSPANTPLKFITRQSLVRKYLDYEYKESDRPELIYFESGQAGFYPMLKAGSDSITIEGSLPATFVEPTQATDTFLFVDGSDELAYCIKYAQFKYMDFKGFGSGIQDTWNEYKRLEGILDAKYTKTSKVGFRGHRRYGTS